MDGLLGLLDPLRVGLEWGVNPARADGGGGTAHWQILIHSVYTVSQEGDAYGTILFALKQARPCAIACSLLTSLSTHFVMPEPPTPGQYISSPSFCIDT
jgi:hypothetical protein